MLLRNLSPLFLLLFASVDVGSAQIELPGTAAGTVFSALLDAFNSGDQSRVARYLAKYDPDRRAAINSFMGFRDQTGGFTLIRIEKSEPLHLEALLKERNSGTLARVTLDVGNAESPVVKGLELRRIAPPSDQPMQLSFEDAVGALDRKATELASEDKFSGAVLVARSGKIVLQKFYGFADRQEHIPNDDETRFRIGSMNKMFTATSILQLVGDGKIELAAPLGKYLPDYPNKDVATKVTIRHLLTHTGGTGDIFTPEYQQHRLEIRELSDYVKLYGSRGLQFEPGTRWEYSNYGFLLLGVVIEKVTGLSYYDYVRSHIFLPSGMRHTDSLPESQEVPNRSVGYIRKNGMWARNTDTLPWRGTSAGGGYSTAEDLFRFAEALQSGKLIKPELFSQMISKQASSAEMPAGNDYGFGMMVSDARQHQSFGHGGGAPGMNGELRVYPSSATVVVVLANLDPPAATRLADVFEERMPVRPSPPPLAPPAEDQHPFRTDVALVHVDAEVRENGLPIPDLGKESFQVTDQGKPQRVLYFGHDEEPLDVVLLLDGRAHMRPDRERISEAADKALSDLRQGDRVAVMTFLGVTTTANAIACTTELISDFTADLVSVGEIIADTQVSEGGEDSPNPTCQAILKGLSGAAQRLQSLAGQGRRRAIVIVTNDKGSPARSEVVNDTIRSLWNANVVVLGVIMHNDTHDFFIGPPYRGVRNAADMTGGDIVKTEDPAEGLHQMLLRLHTRYSLYYALPREGTPGEERKIRVQLSRSVEKRHPRAVVRARLGYVVAPSTQ